MKTFKVKNYKGNIVESLSKFQESHKDMKIVKVVKEGNELKINVQNQLNEDALGGTGTVFILEMRTPKSRGSFCYGVFTSIEKAITNGYMDWCGISDRDQVSYEKVNTVSINPEIACYLISDTSHKDNEDSMFLVHEVKLDEIGDDAIFFAQS